MKSQSGKLAWLAARGWLFSFALLAAGSAKPAADKQNGTVLEMTTGYAAMDRTRMGEHWLERVEEFREDHSKRPIAGIVLVGDSITAAFPCEKFFPDLSVVNRGISGDRIVGVILRLNESVYELRPAKAFLMIGINETLFPKEMSLDECERQYRFLFSELRKHCQGCQIYLQTLLPIYGQYSANNPMVYDLNCLLRRLAPEYGFHLLDVHSVFRAENGEMNREYSDDGVHPNAKGYQRWADFLRPYLYEQEQ